MTLSQEIQHIIKSTSENGVLILKDFTRYFGTRSSAFLLALLTLPISLPFTPPGLNTPFGVVCIILSINLIFNKKDLILPAWIENQKIPFKPDGRFFNSMTKMLEKIELIIKPRLISLTESKYAQPLFGLGALCSSIVMLLPLPIINSVSSLIVLLISVGIITKDGFIALVSAFAGIILMLVAIFMLYLTFTLGVNLLKN
jgi:hypothetical protein